MEAMDLPNFQSIFSLAGKVALITGSSKGLGLAAASGMLQAGASKVYITSRIASACEEACAMLNQLPNKNPDAQAIPITADSSTVEGIEHLVHVVSKTTDHLDILLANAGGTRGASIEKTDEKDFSDVLDLNLKSVFYCVQKFLPLLTARAEVENASRVIVTASVGGIGLANVGEQATYAYAAAKAGVIHLVKQLAVDLGPRHIISNCIAPGFFKTEGSMPFIQRYGGEEELAKTYPNGRLGRSEDFAATAVFLASRGGSHINGHCLVIDGGGIVGRVSP